MIRLLTIIGARPQIIKAAAINREIRNNFSAQLSEIIVHTGQHYDDNMSAVFMNELAIPPADYNLGVGSGTHANQTAGMLQLTEEILLLEKPDAILVYGDTNSTLAGALAAAKLHIPVIHVEAGLRSFNKAMPEEINRICCDHVSTLLFSPTHTAVSNLAKEGFNINREKPFSADKPGVFHCGDIMYDNSLHFSELAKLNRTILSDHALQINKYFLATIHRNSNTDDEKTLKELFRSFINISREFQLPVVIPLHPRTRKMMENYFDAALMNEINKGDTVKIISPASFLDMIMLETSSRLILTDSGGVQKEAYFFNRNCVILREETEWVELVEQGSAILAGSSLERITGAVRELMGRDDKKFPLLFGDGRAAKFICERIIELFSTYE